MKRDFLSLRNIAISLLLLSLVTLPVSAETTMLFDMDDSGSAQMSLAEPLGILFESMNVFASVDKGNILTFKGDLTDSETLESADYSLNLKTTQNSADATFSMWGQEITDLISDTGDFDIQMDLTENSGSLDLSLVANVKKSSLERMLGADLSEIKDDTNLAQELEDQINLIMSVYQLPIDSDVDVTKFEITGSEELTITLEMTITGWGDLMAYSTSLEYQQDTDSVDFVNCLGFTAEDIVYGLLNSETSTQITLSASADKIEGTLSSSAPTDDSIKSPIQGLELDLSKSADKISFNGFVTFSDAQNFVSCLMRDFVPSGKIDSLDYSLKSSGDETTSLIEAKISNLAEEKDGEFTLSFPKETTQEANITVKVPSDMQISSTNGISSDESSVKSKPGQSLSVSYAQKTGVDMNLIIIIVVIVLVALLLLRRRKE